MQRCGECPLAIIKEMKYHLGRKCEKYINIFSNLIHIRLNGDSKKVYAFDDL